MRKRLRELSDEPRQVFTCVGLRQAAVCISCAWLARTRIRCLLLALRPLVQVATSDRRPSPWPRVLPPLGVSYLRSSEFYWDRPRQCPRKPCWAPTRAYPKSRGRGGGDLPTPEASVPLAPLHSAGFSILVDLCFDFREDVCLPVRFQ